MASRWRRSWPPQTDDTWSTSDTPSPDPAVDRRRPVVPDVANRPRGRCPTPYRPGHGQPQSIDPREWRQMRNDVDDGYSLLKRLDESITKVSSTQRLHGNRLHEIQQSVDLAAGRLDRMEDNQRLQAARLSHIGRPRPSRVNVSGASGRSRPSRASGWGAWRRSRPSRVSGWGVSGRPTTQEEQGEQLGRVEGGPDGSTATSAASTTASGVWRRLSSRSCSCCAGVRPADQPPDPYGRVMISRLWPSGESKYSPRPPSSRVLPRRPVPGVRPRRQAALAQPRGDRRNSSSPTRNA